MVSHVERAASWKGKYLDFGIDIFLPCRLMFQDGITGNEDLFFLGWVSCSFVSSSACVEFCSPALDVFLSASDSCYHVSLLLMLFFSLDSFFFMFFDLLSPTVVQGLSFIDMYVESSCHGSGPSFVC